MNSDISYTNTYDHTYIYAPSPYSYKYEMNQFDYKPDEEEEDVYEPPKKPYSRFDNFDYYTANFFNIGDYEPYKNSLEYVAKYRDKLVLKNIMTDLQCEVDVSFASQSNHNIIGRTNETFKPIKYYKLNDNDDTFWIEFYDKSEVNVPIAINEIR